MGTPTTVTSPTADQDLGLFRPKNAASSAGGCQRNRQGGHVRHATTTRCCAREAEEGQR